MVVSQFAGSDSINSRDGLSNPLSQSLFVCAALRLFQMSNLRDQPVDRRRNALVMRMKRAQCDQSPTYLNQVELRSQMMFPQLNDDSLTLPGGYALLIGRGDANRCKEERPRTRNLSEADLRKERWSRGQTSLLQDVAAMNCSRGGAHLPFRAIQASVRRPELASRLHRQ